MYRLITYSYLEISGLYATCEYEKNIYDCSLVANVFMSATLQMKLITGSISHIGKIRAVYCDIDKVDMSFVWYSRNEYNIDPENQIKNYLKILIMKMNVGSIK